GAGTRHARNRLDRAARDNLLPGFRHKKSRRGWLAQSQIEQFPIAEGEFARGEFPDHQFLAREPVVAAAEIASQYFPGGKGGVAVAQDAIERTAAEGAAEVFGEPRGFAPAQSFEGEDVRETVAEQKDVSLLVRPPWRVAGRNFVNHNFLR